MASIAETESGRFVQETERWRGPNGTIGFGGLHVSNNAGGRITLVDNPSGWSGRELVISSPAGKAYVNRDTGELTNPGQAALPRDLRSYTVVHWSES